MCMRGGVCSCQRSSLVIHTGYLYPFPLKKECVKMLINGEKIQGEKSLEVINPYDQSVVAELPQAEEEHVEHATVGRHLGASERRLARGRPQRPAGGDGEQDGRHEQSDPAPRGGQKHRPEVPKT